MRTALRVRCGFVRLLQITAFLMLCLSAYKHGLTSLVLPGYLMVIMAGEFLDRCTRALVILGFSYGRRRGERMCKK